ncbi:MAG: thiamine-phosphate kinase [Candidatus Thermoplasmatota archaeon]|nr:thiamine-phosphate kinase [Candidatus Thermoplasmatota archaeon]
MKIEQMGEKKIIQLIRAMAEEKGIDAPGIFPDDDACVLVLGGELLVITSDCIWLNTHMPPSATPQDSGWYLAAVNLSDLAAMGAKPVGMMLNLSMPRDTEEAWLGEFMEGFVDCLAQNHAPLLGGDTKEGPGVFSATALGVCKKGGAMSRRGARPGDLVGLTGELGLRAYYLESGEGGKALRIRPRIKEGMLLAGEGATSATDTSDGIAISLHYLAERSDVAIKVEEHRLPIGPKVLEASSDPRETALFKGGDFELLFTFPKDAEKNIRMGLEEMGTPFSVIGHVEEGAGVHVSGGRGKSFIPLERRGYEHFTG